MKIFARVLLVFGLVIIALSVMMLGMNQPGSPEGSVNTLNIGLGALMVVLAGAYLIYSRKNDNANVTGERMTPVKGEQTTETKPLP